YLNRLSYGRGLVGPAAAAEAMFGVSPADLSWAQAALLAVLPRAPSYLDPYQHVDRAQRRQRALIDALFEQGLLSEEDRRRARDEPLRLRPVEHAFEAAYFVEALRAEGRVRTGEATHTTLDLALQRDLEGLV